MATRAVVYQLIARDRATRTFATVGQSATRLSRTATTAGAAIKAGLAVGAVGTAALGASVIKMAGDFEKNMNRVEALSGASGKQLKMLRDQAKDLGRSTQYGAAQSADAMAQLATAGLTVNQIYGAMPSVLSLASSEQLNLTRAAEITTNVLTGYGMSIKEIPHAVDAMVKASVKANTSVDDLGEAFKYSGPIAHQAGIQFEEAVAATALMGNAGIKASMAGTALRGAVTRLLAPTKKISTTLHDLGVNVATSDGKLRPLTQIVDELAKKGATTGDIMTIFGQRAGPGMAALIQQGSKKLAGLTKELENSGGTADRISKIQMKGWRGEVTRLKNAWEGLMIELGDTGVLTGATKALSGITLGVRNFADWVNTRGIPAAKGLGREMGDLIPVETIKDRFTQAKTLVADFFAGLRGKSTGTVDVSVPRVDKAPVLVPASAATDVGRQIRDAFTGGIRGIDWTKIGGAMGLGLVKGLEAGAKLAVKLTAAFGSLLAKVDWVGVGIAIGRFVPSLLAGFIVGLINFDIGGLLKGLGNHWQEVLLSVLFVAFMPAKWIAGIGKALGKIPFLGRLLSWAFGIFAKFSKFLVGGAGKLLAGFGRGLLQGLTRLFPSLASGIAGFLGRAALAIVGYGGRFTEAAIRLAKAIGPGLVKGAEGLGRVTVRIIEIIVRPFAKAGGWLFRHGTAVVGGLLRGIASAAKAVGGWVMRTVITPLRSRFATAGSWLLTRGRAIVSGLKSGVVAGAKAIGSWVSRTVIAPVTSRFATAGSWLVSKGRAIVSGMKSGVTTAVVGIRKFLTDKIVSPVTGRFTRASTWLKSAGGSLISGLKSGITGAMKSIGTWLKKNLIDPIVGAVKKFFGIRSPSRVFAGIGGHLVSGLVRGMAQTSGTAIAKKIFGDMPSALGAIVSKGLVSVASLPGKAMKALGGLGSKFLGMLGLGDSGKVGGGVNRWSPLVAQVLKMLGAPAYALGPVLQRIQQESGGNPNAINNWDINAKNGDPSRGLMQTIGSTFNAYAGPFRGRGIYDPLANIYAGVNYAMHRYGAGWVNVMTRPGGYAKGSRGRGAAPGWAWVGERGPELINLKGGEDILSNPDSMKVASQFGIRLPGYASGTVANAQARVKQAKEDLERAKERKYGVQAAKTRLKAAQQELAAAKRRTKMAVDNALTAGFKKTIATGTASAIKSAIKSMVDKLQNAGVSKAYIKSVLKKSEKLQSLATKKADVTAKIQKAKEFAADQSSNLRETFSVTGTSATTVGGLISEMKSKQADAKQFASQVEYLKKQGLSADLIGQLAEAGPGSQLHTLLAGATKSQIAQLNSLSKSGVKLADSYGKTVADAMFDSGKKAGDGFLTGLKEQEKQLAKEMEKLADALIKSIKKKLGIKSPSRVMRDQIGKPTALGVVAGMDATLPAIARSAQRMVDTASGARPRRIVIPSSVSGQQPAAADPQQDALRQLVDALQTGQLGATEVHVHFNDDRLRDLIDVQVKPKVKASEDRQAFRARVGRRG
ncbi:phage tail tape measure protein [Streptomyces cinnabarinus]|uniref:Phage tail tape measure protein n=1 Tax=Streptomyces cinnabarinus TaxID=67287 RepID=A0ABY7K6N4_9ACTN|nr:phage tail tape measure protein [Streptomyces cinnabarinus]WAZ20162.1 phage tail tape measure protein [Streptomyces cinnabarinus]